MVNWLKPIAFSTDDYFINREDLIPDENGRLNFEGLDALEIEMFNRDMNALLAGEQVDIPTFNFITGVFYGLVSLQPRLFLYFVLIL